MLKELFDLVKGQATDTVINNPDVPNQYNNDVVAEATNTVASGLRNVVAGGGVQNILSMFGSNPNKKSLLSNPIVSMMMGHFASKLINKTNDPNDSTFSLEKLLASITGGRSNEVTSRSGGLGGLLNQFNGGSQSNGGGGLMDIVKTLAGGAQEQQQRNGGSLLDLIKGFAR